MIACDVSPVAMFLDGYNDDDDDDDCVAQCHHEQRARQDLLSQPTITAAH